MGKSPWLRELVIVPEAHGRIFDFALQVEMYDVFHLHWLSRLGHMLGTPALLVGLGALLSHAASSSAPLTAPLAFGAGLVIPAAQLVYASALDGWVAVVALVPLGAMALAANLLTLAAGPLAALALMAIGLGLQTFSHLMEPVPPPWSGTRGWRGLRDTLRTTPPARRLGLLVLTAVSLFLEAWAALRIFSVQVLLAMLACGYRPALREALLMRRQRILRDWALGWGESVHARDRVLVGTCATWRDARRRGSSASADVTARETARGSSRGGPARTSRARSAPRPDR